MVTFNKIVEIRTILTIPSFDAQEENSKSTHGEIASRESTNDSPPALFDTTNKDNVDSAESSQSNLVSKVTTKSAAAITFSSSSSLSPSKTFQLNTYPSEKEVCT